MEEMICETDEFLVRSKRSRERQMGGPRYKPQMCVHIFAK